MQEAVRRRAIELAGEVVVNDHPGDVIRSEREHYGFTQSWLAPRLGVRRESLSRIESGRSSPTLSVVDRFARVMSLARHVRQAAARSETSKAAPDAGAFETVGRELDLDPEETRAIAAEAISRYEDKRRQLLESVDADDGGSR
jgi:ribosome-binding protein aMBF1 (putative translation factor)